MDIWHRVQCPVSCFAMQSKTMRYVHGFKPQARRLQLESDFQHLDHRPTPNPHWVPPQPRVGSEKTRCNPRPPHTYNAHLNAPLLSLLHVLIQFGLPSNCITLFHNWLVAGWLSMPVNLSLSLALSLSLPRSLSPSLSLPSLLHRFSLSLSC